jgi:hypothetical protein
MSAQNTSTLKDEPLSPRARAALEASPPAAARSTDPVTWATSRPSRRTSTR